MGGWAIRLYWLLRSPNSVGIICSLATSFLKKGWQDYDPTNKKSLSYFVGRKMADTYRSMKIPTIGREFEDQWERVYVPVIGLKYQNMRCNFGNDARAQYFGELHD
jgi:hypothetical protein